MAKKAEPQDAREYKTFQAFTVKMDADQGIVEHLVSVFGVLDLGGDVTHPGSFTKTIQEREKDITVLDSHNRYSTKGVVGIPLRLWEVSKVELPQDVLDKWPEATGGLMAETQFLLETTEGKDVFTRIKAGAVKEFSFAYDALDHDYEKITIKGKEVTVRNLRTIRLWEYGPVVFGMNQAARAVSAKSVADHLTNIEREIAFLRGEGSGEPLGVLNAEEILAHEKARSLSREVERVRSAFRKAHCDPYGGSEYDVKEVLDEYVVVRSWSDIAGDYFKVTYEEVDGVFNFAKSDLWVTGDYVFVERVSGTGEKEVSNAEILLQIEQEQIEIALND